MARLQQASRTALTVFLVLGTAASAGTWFVLTAITPHWDASRSPGIIKHSYEVDAVYGQSEASWTTIETNLFARYAQAQGWDDTSVKFVIFVGESTKKHVASIIAGEGADVILATTAQAAFFSDQGMIEPLDDYLEDWADYRDGFINKKVLDSCRGRDGKVLGLPSYVSSPAFYSIRRDWLAALGLEAPDTFEKARVTWHAFTYDDPDGNGKDDTYGYAMPMLALQGAHVNWGLTPFMCAVGVRWYNTDIQGRYIPTFNTPEAVTVLQFIKRCYKEGLFGTDVMFRKDPPFLSHLAMQVAGMGGSYRADYYEYTADWFGIYDKIQAVPFLWMDEQAKKQRRYGTRSYPTRFRCIMRTSSNKQAAWRYLKYFFSREIYGKYMNAIEQPSGRLSYLGRFGLLASESPWLLLRNDVKLPVLLDLELRRTIEPLDEFVVSAPIMMASWTTISKALSEIFVDFYLDRYPSAQAALDEAEKQFVAILEVYNQQLN